MRSNLILFVLVLVLVNQNFYRGRGTGTTTKADRCQKTEVGRKVSGFRCQVSGKLGFSVQVQVSVFGSEGLPLALKHMGWMQSQRDFRFRYGT